MSRVTQGVLAAAALALLSGGAAAAYAQSAPDDAERSAVQAREDARDARDQARDARDMAREAREHGRAMAEHGRHMAMASHDVLMGEFDPKAHADHLRNILQLRPNQEAALTAYLDATGAKHGRMVAVDNTPPPKTTPERLARMEKRIAEREAESRARIEATRRFYGQLDERQKKAFDELPMMMSPDLGPGRMIRIMHRGGDFERFGPPPLPPMPPMPPEPPAPPPPPRT